MKYRDWRIEHLEDEVRRLQSKYEEMEDYHLNREQDLEQENKRLREALEAIAECSCSNPQPCDCLYPELARAALKGEGK